MTPPKHQSEYPPDPFKVSQDALDKIQACLAQLLAETAIPWYADDGIDCETERDACLAFSVNHIFWDIARFIAELWESQPFHDIEVVDLGYDVSSYARSTNDELCDKVTTYSEFLTACNGNTQPTYCSGAGMSAENISSNVTDFIADWAHKRFYQLLKDQGLGKITCLDGGAWDAHECFLHEIDFVSESGEVWKNLFFDVIAAVDCPYIECGEYVGPSELLTPARFKDWTLWDFQQMSAQRQGQ